MQRMSFADASIDLIIHSDTLEHVPDSKPLERVHARSEAGRPFVLYCAIVVGRLTRTRRGLPPSYHGRPGSSGTTIVQTEYGADFWCETFDAGFRSKPDKSNLPSLGGNPCNQSLKTGARSIVTA